MSNPIARQWLKDKWDIVKSRPLISTIVAGTALAVSSTMLGINAYKNRSKEVYNDDLVSGVKVVYNEAPGRNKMTLTDGNLTFTMVDSDKANSMPWNPEKLPIDSLESLTVRFRHGKTYTLRSDDPYAVNGLVPIDVKNIMLSADNAYNLTRDVIARRRYDGVVSDMSAVSNSLENIAKSLKDSN